MPYKKELQHGHNGHQGVSPTYQSWKAMKARCYRPANNKYHLYGGAGIRVCDEWHDFRCFLHDMGERPKGASLDRIDPNGDYSPSNCRWADHFSQNRNRKLQKKNKTGIAGVHFEVSRWRVRISGKHIGNFSDFFEACCARRSAEGRLWK